MVGFEMKMPERCDDCPCSYEIRSGKWQGHLMCEALEKMDPEAGKESYLVDAWSWGRPTKCPMREITVEYDPS